MNYFNRLPQYSEECSYTNFYTVIQNDKLQCGQFTEKNGKTESALKGNSFRRTLNLDVATRILPPGKTSKDFLSMSSFKKTVAIFLGCSE